MDEPKVKQIEDTWIVIGNGVASAGPTEDQARHTYQEALRRHQLLTHGKAHRSEIEAPAFPTTLDVDCSPGPERQ